MPARRAPRAEPGVALPAPLPLEALVERLGGSVDAGARGVVLSHVVSPWSPHDERSLLPVLRRASVRWAEQAMGVVLLPPSLAEHVPVGRRWVHAQAGWALAEVLSLAEPAPPPDERALALVEPGAEVHESARIGAYCVIRRGASIGEHCLLEPHVVVHGGVRLGRHVRVGASAVLGRPGFGWVEGPTGLRRMPQLGGVEVEDEVEIGPCATIDAGTLGPTRLGRGCKLDAHVHVGHNVQIGAHTIIAAQSGFAGSSTVGRGVLIGGQVGVADHLDIGDGARLAARSGVIGDVSAGATVAGYPAVDHQRWLRGMAIVLSKSKRQRP